ncbi:MAG: TetR/AcrR family transcriptional regulator [Solirubrobacterales bacterium]
MATTTTANPQAADAAPATSHRERLLAAAIECLRERGYARTTARDLVAASGTNLASIGYHFGSKENLLNEAIAQGFTAWTAEIERAAFADSEAGAIERLGISLEATIDRFAELRPFLVAFVEAFPQAVRTPELRERMAAAYEEVRITAAVLVRRGLEAEGIEIGEAESETIASVLIAVCDGLILQWLVDPDRVPSSRQLLAGAGAALAAVSRR